MIMKKLYSTIFCLLLILCVSAQETTQEAKESSNSTAVEFMKKDGRLLLKEFIKIPDTDAIGLGCEVLIMTDMVDKSKVGCLRLEKQYYSSQYDNGSYIGTLDNDEIGACIQSLDYIKTAITSIPENYTEITYSTNDGVEFGAFFSQSRKEAKWIVFVKVKRYVSKSLKTIDIENIDTLIGILQSAHKLIEGKI